VFLRAGAAAPVRHVGSVTAPSADVARGQAGRLFPVSARDVRLCPADEVRRYAAETLADRAPDGGAEPCEAGSNASPEADSDAGAKPGAGAGTRSEPDPGAESGGRADP